MKTYLDIFKEFAAIKRCSHDYSDFESYLIQYLEKIANVEFKRDNAKNIYAKKGNPKICLQAHTDMVCVGNFSNYKLNIKDNIMTSNNTSLGADNGIGVAYALYSIEKFNDIEILLTAEEEIGMYGAKALDIEIESDKLLNLDAETLGEVIIGAAGGFDACISYNLKRNTEKLSNLCKITTKKEYFLGGHSGIQIDENIPNAIKELSYELSNCKDIKIININGGEARNAIPRHVEAVVSTNEISFNEDKYSIEKLENKEVSYIENSKEVLNLINSMHSGVVFYDKELVSPITSMSMGLISTDTNKLNLKFLVRSNSSAKMEKLHHSISSQISLIDGATCELSAPYPAWDKEENEFVSLVANSVKKIYGSVAIKTVHAGLECGILKRRWSKPVYAVATGPNIKNPHSTEELFDIKSGDITMKIVEDIIQSI